MGRLTRFNLTRGQHSHWWTQRSAELGQRWPVTGRQQAWLSSRAFSTPFSCQLLSTQRAKPSPPRASVCGSCVSGNARAAGALPDIPGWDFLICSESVNSQSQVIEGGRAGQGEVWGTGPGKEIFFWRAKADPFPLL